MKCPYREFRECIVEQCPSCNYKEAEICTTNGRCPNGMSKDEAIRRGMVWEETRTVYQFVSCKLIDKGVQPAPPIKQIENVINNNTKTNVVIRKSIF